MTCIVGLKNNGIVYIGADTGVYSGYINMSTQGQNPKKMKIFKKGDFISSTTGQARGSHIIEKIWTIPDRKVNESTDDYIHKTFLDSIVHTFKSANHLEEDKGVVRISSESIFAYDNRLFSLSSDLLIVEYDGYVANGCGIEYALGSLHTTRKEKDQEARVTKALEAAAEFCTHVNAPFVVMSQGKDKEED